MWDFIWGSLGGGAVAAALLAIAGFAGRSQLAHWLNKDIEGIKARHTRELEAYRVTLIAAAEQVKAKQEVRTAGALKVLERKFEVLNDLNGKLGRICFEAVMLIDLQLRDPQDVARDAQGLGERADQLSIAHDSAAIFLTHEANSRISSYCALVMQQVHRLVEMTPLPADQPVETICAQLEAGHHFIHTYLRGEIELMISPA